MRYAAITVMAMFVCAGLAQAGVRADLSGDAVVNFATTMDMPFRTVGNPGNAGDTEIMTYDHTTGYGAVDYVYNIGKFEVTAGQYTEFLNAVAATDTYELYNTEMWSNVLERLLIRGRIISSESSANGAKRLLEGERE